MTNESRGMLLGTLGVTIFGLTLPATRFIVEYLDPVFIATGRAVIAAFVAGIILFLNKAPLPVKAQFPKLIITALGVVIGFPVLSSSAMQTVPASHGGVVLGLLPIVTAIIGALVCHERPSKGFWLSGLFGSALVILFALKEGAGGLSWGDLALFGAVLSAATGYAVGGQLAKELGGWQVICWALVIAVPFIIFPAWLNRPESIAVIPLSAWGAFLYLALFSQLLGFFFWNKGLVLGGVVRVSQVQLIQPFVTIIAAAFLLGEHINLQTIVFALLVVLTVLIGKRMPIYTNDVKTIK